jgi:hypothetical protein
MKKHRRKHKVYKFLGYTWEVILTAGLLALFAVAAVIACGKAYL